VIDSYRKLHTGRLLLTPEDARRAPEPQALQALLADAGLAGAPLCKVPGSFAAGPSLLELIGFTGCAVQIGTAPDDDRDFVHVRIEGPHPQPILKHGRNSRPPRCPACRVPLADWAEQTATAETAPALHCAACGAQQPAECWDWRSHAGCGRLFVSIEEVFPGEARPLPRLIDLLSGLGIGPWRYFYVQD